MKLSEKASFLVEFLDLPVATGVPEAKWEVFQILFLNNVGRYGIDVKSRQIAWSWTAAADAVADSILNPGTPHVFVSINQTEAREKVRYAKHIIDALDSPVRPKLVKDSQFAIEFENGSRLESHPCRPPRGKPQARIYLDEIAHYKEGLDRSVYRAANPATIKGGGYLRLGSSPLGATGIFWEIATEALRPYPGYEGHRRYIPWWLTHSFCHDVKMASQLAPMMPTEERVYTFGTRAIAELFENMFLEDFQQEMECAWVDESVAWIDWDIIRENQDHDLMYFAADSPSSATDAIRKLAKESPETAYYGGFDVGRRRNVSELCLLGHRSHKCMPVRLLISMANQRYDVQLGVLQLALSSLPIRKLLVDMNGIGSQLAETLEGAYPGVAEGADFSMPNKERWAVECKIQAERGAVPLPPERDFLYQIHSIKRKTTAAKNVVFDSERNDRHHADKFWAWALGVWGASQGGTGAWTWWG